MIIQRGSLFKLNGVIVVTTKRPTEGRLRIKFEAGINLEIPDLTSYNLMDAREKLQLEWAAGLYETDKGPVKQQELLNQYYSKLADVERGTNTYWLSQPLQTGVGQRYNMRLEWGAEEFQVGASVAYNNVSGAMKGSERNNFSGNITLQYDHKNLTFRNQTKITINNSDQGPHASIKLNPDDKTSYGGFSSYAKMNPYWRIYDDEGNYIPRYKKILSDEYISNPLYDASKNIINKSAYKNITNNLQIEWRIIDGLTLRGTLGISTQSNTSDLFIPPSHSAFLSDTYAKPENVFRKGKYTYGTGESNNIMGNITLNYSKTFNEKHNLTAGIDF